MDAHVPIFDVTRRRRRTTSRRSRTSSSTAGSGTTPTSARPFGQANFDFAAPFGDVVHYVIVRVLGLVLGDPVLVFNAFFLLCFPLIAVVAYAVMRDLGAAPAPALVGGVLFAFLPYHLLRNQSHLFLTSYYAIPLAVWLVVAVAEGRRLLEPRRAAPDAARRRRLPRRRRGVELLRRLRAARAAHGRAGRRDRAPLAARSRCRAPPSRRSSRELRALPRARDRLSARARRQRQRRRARARRERAVRPEARLHGHPAARAPRRRPGAARQGLLRDTPLRSEGFDPSLGIVATLGLLAAIIVLLATGLAGAGASRCAARGSRPPARSRSSPSLIGTIGGDLGAHRLRADAAGARLEPALARHRVRRPARGRAAADRARRPPARARTAGVDARPPSPRPSASSASSTRPRRATRPTTPRSRPPGRSTTTSPARCSTAFRPARRSLQLPYMGYPENGPLHGDRRLRPVQGLPALDGPAAGPTAPSTAARRTGWRSTRRSRPTSSRPPPRPPASARVYVDRAGYADGGAGVDRRAGEARRRRHVARCRPTGACSSSTCARPPRAWRAHTTPAERAQLADALLYPVALGFGDGFSYQEIGAGRPFRWAGTDARLTLDNPLRGPRTVRFTAQLFGGAGGALDGDVHAARRHAADARRRPTRARR